MFLWCRHSSDKSAQTNSNLLYVVLWSRECVSFDEMRLRTTESSERSESNKYHGTFETLKMEWGNGRIPLTLFAAL